MFSFCCCYCCWVTKSCLTLCDPMDSSIPGFFVPHHLLEFAEVRVHWWCHWNHLILCLSLLLLPSIFPKIKVFSNESALPIMWPKYWSFSFSISPSKVYSGLISFRIDWLLFMGFSRQKYWSGLHVLSELSTMTCPSWVALHSMAHSFIELGKIRLVSFLWLWFSVCLPSDGKR